jgi:diadenosine tetraphosphate (Ap4A) HIT family hydrolase
MESPSPYVQRLPIGERVPFPAEGIPSWDIFPIEGDLQIKVLEPPVLPEPPRRGEDGPESCPACQEPLRNAIWSDDHWVLRAQPEPPNLPVVVILEPVGHYDLIDLPAELSAGLGPMIQRVERAILSLGGIARVHVNRWGDGSYHLHLWFFARPEGMLQLRGTCLPIWDDLLPPVPLDEWRATTRAIATELARDGGTVH